MISVLLASIVTGTVLNPMDALVSYSTGGARVEDILRQLTLLSGTKIKASDRVKGEILIVQATRKPLGELLDRIAEVDGATWEMDGDTRVLTRSTKLRESPIAAERNLLIAQLKDAIDQATKPALEQRTGGAAVKDQSLRLAWLAMKSLGPAEFSQVEGSTRAVYSDDPNPVQKKFPGSIANLILEAAKRDPSDSSPPPRRVLVGISRSIFQGNSLDLVRYDAQGKRLPDVTISVQTPELSILSSSQLPNSRLPGQSNPKVKPYGISFSTLAGQFKDYLSTAMANQPVAMSEDLRKRILHPELVDPLSYLVAEPLGNIASTEKRSLVASVPDLGFLTSLILAQKPLTNERFENWLRSLCSVDRSRDNWLMVTPTFVHEARTLRTDRFALGDLLRLGWSNGGVPALQLGQYYNRQPSRLFETLSPFFAFLLMPEIAQMVQPDSVGAVRLYAALSDDQRSQLLQGRVLIGSDLDANVRLELQNWLFNASVSGMHPSEDQSLDPTDAFPDGSMLTARLRLTVNQSPVVMPYYATGLSLNQQPLTAESLGYELKSQEQGTAQIKQKFTRYRLGLKRTFTLMATGPRYKNTGRFYETQFDRSAAPVKLEQLPKDFLSAVENAKKGFADAAIPGGPPAKIPPPF
jgi:hypothetical protein